MEILSRVLSDKIGHLAGPFFSENMALELKQAERFISVATYKEKKWPESGKQLDEECIK
jgi:hypothetical protein